MTSESGASVFLRLFTVRADPIPFSFMEIAAFLLPVFGIAYGFDSISGERSRGTLPRLVSQPIHRDDVINGKFVAGLTTIGLTLGVVVLIVAGVGIFALGVVPDPSDAFRLLTWLLASFTYVRGLACHGHAGVGCVPQRRDIGDPDHRDLAGTHFFGGLLFTLVADVISPVDTANPTSELTNARTQASMSRLSPVVLYNETATALLVPEVRTLGFVTMDQIDRAIVSELSFTQSVLLVWPQLVAMVAGTVVLFAIAYVKFIRQEVRA